MGEGKVGSDKRHKKTPRNKPPLTITDSMDGANSNKKMKKMAKNKKQEDTELPEVKPVETHVSTRTYSINKGKNSAELSDKKRNKLKNKRRDKGKKEDSVVESVPQSNEDCSQQTDKPDGASSDKKMKKVARKNKRKSTEPPEAETPELVVSTPLDDVHEGKNSADKKRNKLKKKRKVKENKKSGAREHVPQSNESVEDSNQQSSKSKGACEMKTEATLLDDDDEVYQISSGDEDETTGMKRWITKYHRARPGAEVLLEGINDFLVDYWAQKEKEKKEKEEEAAEGGWTVVTHFKGRKKTTDAETGTTVGSVAPAAVMDKMSKKKDKQVGLSFYRFQRKEAQRNEIMLLQSKFEQDKKRIQQLRAERKFRPY